MGREAVVRAEVGDETGEVRAFLETGELILRGTIRRRYPRSFLDSVTVKEEALCFGHKGESVRLHLGTLVAEAWRKAIVAGPPSLRTKLGLATDKKALLVGRCDDEDLAEALDGVLVDDSAVADLIVARIDGPADLAAAQAVQAKHPGLALWAVYLKGRDIAFGDGEIRTALRAAGFRDTKSCAVSDRLTATRYNRK